MSNQAKHERSLRFENLSEFLFSKGIGIFASFFMISIFLLVILALLTRAEFGSFYENISNQYIISVIKFTFLEATLSTFLSVLLGLIVALFMLKYSGSFFIILLNYLFGVAFVSPVIIVVFAIVKIHGLNGWVNSTLSLFGFDFGNYLYGLKGILLAHIFFNMPFAARFFYLQLSKINSEKYMLAIQLGLSNWQIFKYIEFYEIKKALMPVSILIFILCFTSFAAVITLGGNPSNSTLEAAIYQAIKYNFDLELAINLAILQLLFCLSFLAISNYFKAPTFTNNTLKKTRNNFKTYSTLSAIFDLIAIFIISAFILAPFMAIIPYNLKINALVEYFDQTSLQAIITSLQISLTASVIALFLSLSIVNYSHYLLYEKSNKKISIFVENSSLLILILPSILFSVGLFLLIRKFSSLQSFSQIAVIIVNIFVIMPFMIKILNSAFTEIYMKYFYLSQNLGLSSYDRFKIVVLPQIKKQIAFALSIGATLSLGDLGAIAFFGSDNLLTLPLLLYRYLGSYQLEKAAICALILLLLCLFLFVVLDFLISIIFTPGKRKSYA